MSGHDHHISSAKFLWGIGAALFFLTVITVAVTYIHFPAPWNIVVAISIAVVKATLVAAFFMNLYWDSKFNGMLLVVSLFYSHDWNYASGHVVQNRPHPLVLTKYIGLPEPIFQTFKIFDKAGFI